MLSTSNSNKNIKTTFTSNYRDVTDKLTKKLLYKNNSWFFRSDLEWKSLATELERKYKNVDKVNVHCFACSEGTEPFSLAMMLMEEMGPKKAQKFFPIIASDIDAEILVEPKKGILNVSEDDLVNIKANIGDNYKKYINISENYTFSPKLSYKVCSGTVTPLLRDAVVFKNYDIKSRITDVPKRNTVLLCRNFWSYLDKPYQKNNYAQKKLLENINTKFGSNNNSMIIIGDFDRNCFIEEELVEKGSFYNTYISEVFATEYEPKERFRDKYYLGNAYYLKMGDFKKTQTEHDL
jgi:chemotaxis methyl-accepting protein methylase